MATLAPRSSPLPTATITYEFKGTGAPRQHVRLAGFHHFQHGLDEIKDCISGCGTNANLLAREIVQLEVKLESDDQELVAEDKAEVEAKRNKMAKSKKYIGILEAFYNEIKSQWDDITCRTTSHVHWAPEISVDVQSCKYTEDICTFEVDAARFRDHFKGNVVDLGVKFSPWQLTNMLYPQSGGRTVFKFPINGLLRINGWVPRELLAHPDCFDSNGEPCLIVMKDGNTPDLTVGRLLARRPTFAMSLALSASNSPSTTTIGTPARSSPRATPARSSSMARAIWLVFYTPG